MIALTGFTKCGGSLTKRISLGDDGKPVSDASQCTMATGSAHRLRLSDLRAFAQLIGRMSPEKALALGALRDDLPGENVEVVTKARLGQMNGASTPHLIARTAEHISYQPGQQALALLDFDTKGMPAAVRTRVDAAGGFWPAIASVLPELSTTAHVLRASTSAGLYRTDTGERLPGSDGMHAYVVVRDGGDGERFLRALHDRCWLAGLGWHMVGAGGQLLDRSIVDRMVGTPERLVFEGAPVLVAPLAQDQAARLPVVTDGDTLDTLAACPPLRIVEREKLRALRAKDAHRLAPDRAKARETFVTERAERIVARTGCTAVAARQTVERQCDGVLRPDVVLPFDDAELAGCTVGNVLAEPEKFTGATMADPLEGVGYGICVAKVMRRTDGTVWIHSFAHGRTVYELKHDAAAIEAALRKGTPAEAADRLVRLLPIAAIGTDEEQHLRELTSELSGVKARPLAAKIKAARAEQAKQKASAEHERRAAERRDPRLQITAPADDAPWLPQMGVLIDVLGASRAAEPPMRDTGGWMSEIVMRRAALMHSFTARSDNEGETEDGRLLAPEHLLLTRLGEIRLSEMIERHIDYVDATGRSVHLPMPFVRHFLVRPDDNLPIVTAVAVTPMILPDGTVLSGHGLDRARSIVFRVPRELRALIPTVESCTETPVADAMRFLTDTWLRDVATDYAGKCVLIAVVATILERLLLPQRPAFFLTAGQRGGGKTTTANMIALAALGSRAAAAAWSPNDEERRKALLAYLMEGVALICWDNIPRGAAISCPSIEKSLTAEIYSDRLLGSSEFRSVPATAVHLFTGNNIAPRGDLASRSVHARLQVDRPDPENRHFDHSDPLAWTEAHRGHILQALYTILLGNPRLRQAAPPPAETRFKEWQHLIGSAIEYAAKQHEAATFPGDATWNQDCPPKTVSFRELFLAGEADEEQTSSLNTVIEVLQKQWPNGFKASDVAAYASRAEEGPIEFKAALEHASGKAIKVVTPTVITWRLKAIVDAPVTSGGAVVVLRCIPDKSGHGGDYQVKEIRR